MRPSEERGVIWDILTILAEHQRQATGAACAARPCERCLAPHRERITRAVRQGARIDFALPSFPGKSPNKSKVLGTAPDMGEQLSLKFLQSTCEQIQDIYQPGARIIICSDGHVFSDIVQIPDSDITFYQAELRRMIEETHCRSLQLFTLADKYSDLSFDQMRQVLVERYGEDLVELRSAVRSGGNLLVLYRGLTKFLLEDADRPDYQGSRAALLRKCRERAYGVMQRSRAWGKLIAEHFPHAVRLSIHPQPCGSSKFGINLLESSDNWTTPWHSAAVDIGDRFILMRRSEAEALGAELVCARNRPSHFVMKKKRGAPKSIQIGHRSQAAYGQTAHQVTISRGKEG